ESKTKRRRVSGYPRLAKFFLGIARSRNARTKNVQRSTCAHGARSGRWLGRRERRAFFAPKRSRSARRDVLHRHRQNGAGRKPDALSTGIIFQITCRDAAV